MMSPIVTETTPRLEPVTPDPFIAPVTRPPVTRPADGGTAAPAPAAQLALRM